MCVLSRVTLSAKSLTRASILSLSVSLSLAHARSVSLSLAFFLAFAPLRALSHSLTHCKFHSNPLSIKNKILSHINTTKDSSSHIPDTSETPPAEVSIKHTASQNTLYGFSSMFYMHIQACMDTHIHEYVISYIQSSVEAKTLPADVDFNFQNIIIKPKQKLHGLSSVFSTEQLI